MGSPSGNPVASLAALLREADAWDDFAYPEAFAEWLLARGVQYAPREPTDNRGIVGALQDLQELGARWSERGAGASEVSLRAALTSQQQNANALLMERNQLLEERAMLRAALRPLADQDCESWGCDTHEGFCAPTQARKALRGAAVLPPGEGK